MGIKGNEEVDKAAKQAIDIPGMTTTRLPYTDFYLTIRKARNSGNGKGSGKTALVSYTILIHTLKNGKVHTIAVGNMRSN